MYSSFVLTLYISSAKFYKKPLQVILNQSYFNSNRSGEGRSCGYPATYTQGYCAISFLPNYRRIKNEEEITRNRIHPTPRCKKINESNREYPLSFKKNGSRIR